MTVHLVTLREQEALRFEREAREAPKETFDPDRLADALEQAIRGEVRFTDGDRALYATDASNYRQVPIGVVIPADAEDVVRAVNVCARFGAPILSRGGGTSLAGQCCNHAVIFDMTKNVNEVLDIDVDRRLGRVRPGCVLDDFRDAAKKHGLNFGPDPATHSRNAIGGMLGNNSCGTHSLLSHNNGYGLRTSDNTHELEVLTYDGLRLRVGETPPEMLDAILREGGRRAEIYRRMKSLVDRHANLVRERYPKIPRRVSGYNLDELLPENNFHVARALVGTESTCVTILEATLHLVPNPKARTLLVLGYSDVYQACDDLCFLREFRPTALEAIDELLLKWEKQRGDYRDALRLMPKGNAFLWIEFGGDSKEDSDAQARHVIDEMKKHRGDVTSKIFDKPHEEDLVWSVREGSLGSTAWVEGHPDTWGGWEDSAVAVEKVGPYLRDLRKLMDAHGYHPSIYGHFGQGCLHCRIGFDLYTKEGIESFTRFMDEASSLVVSYGGSLSGEHGDGQSRAQFLPKMFGPELMDAMREFKRIWDPAGKMNPGKIVDAYSITENLRIGPDYDPPQPATHFEYPHDEHAFSRAVLRCVGIGKCRDHGGQTMCPSYMVTREEKHSTRGRARVLWEMLNGNVIEDGWKSEEVRDALHLCLSCKGCKRDCPVSVDMATLKAEFLSHYYEGRVRPRSAYAFGYVHRWLRLAHGVPTLPALLNFLLRIEPLAALFKLAGGIAPQRTIPELAPVRFKKAFAKRRKRETKGERVVLFADTFNDFLHPDVAHAAVDVLERAGFDVSVPMQDLCCGRPFYDFGMLDVAKDYLRRILDTLRAEIDAGTPFVVLEPSCAAVFRDELTNLFPSDWTARRLHEQTFTLAEFLEKKAPKFTPPRLARKALVHGHCHQKALAGLESEKSLLEKMSLEVAAPETGCCGMAGSFGFEKGEHYDVSVKCGERVLLPEVRRADDDVLVVADGFSCQEQIAQQTNRRALHVAQVLQLGLEGELKNGERPEKRFVDGRKIAERAAERRALATFGIACGLLAGATIASVALYRRSR